jgi:hypothetical protein
VKPLVLVLAAIRDPGTRLKLRPWLDEHDYRVAKARGCSEAESLLTLGCFLFAARNNRKRCAHFFDIRSRVGHIWA